MMTVLKTRYRRVHLFAESDVGSRCGSAHSPLHLPLSMYVYDTIPLSREECLLPSLLSLPSVDLSVHANVNIESKNKKCALSLLLLVSVHVPGLSPSNSVKFDDCWLCSKYHL